MLKTIRRVVISCLLLWSATTCCAQSKEQDLDGSWWNRLDRSFKLGYVSGFAQGHERAAMAHITACMGIWMFGEPVKTAYTREQWQKLCFPTSDFDGVRMGQFLDGVDSFYRDYRNQKIDISSAMEYVRDEIKGKPQAELDDSLSKLRKVAAGENPYEKKQK
jgi:hypothetical protein